MAVILPREERKGTIALERTRHALIGLSVQAEYFDEIPDEKVPKDMLDLALHIVETHWPGEVATICPGLLIEGQQIT